ncbi:MAG: S41 family peptidase [Actinomycetota bacterium]|nr:S41 family peptidase [Actinomycetota bacterium]
MKKIVLKIVIYAVVIIFVFSTGLWTGVSCSYIRDYTEELLGSITGNSSIDNGNGIDSPEGTGNVQNIEPIMDALDLISGNSISEKNEEELVRSALEGMLSTLDDKYSDYFTEEEYRLIMESYNGTISGIGVVVTLDEEERVIVVRVLEGTPASKTDIKAGDIISGVEHTDIKSMELEKVVAMIKGETGTEVDLEFYRPSDDSSYELTITRAKFDVPNLISESYEEDIGYIWYYDFQMSGVDQLDREVQELIDDGMKGLILDLRNNPGGAWDDAIEVCDLFIDEGMIVTVKGRLDGRERIDEYFAREGKYTEIPIIVLINGYSASASELVAGALKDNDRAVLIGEKSYGKGAVQALYGLSDGSGIKFTTAKYFLPSGISVEGVGVKPDIVVELELDAEEDVQLNRAIEEMEILISEIE